MSDIDPTKAIEAALRIGFAEGQDQAKEEIEHLRAALRELIYEITHLSPQEDDGSHRCTITGETLRKARMALGEKE
jgi:hypothetical protein